MKRKKVLLSLICLAAILLALHISAFAIGFKAEEKYNSVFIVTSGNALGSGFAVGENCIVTNAHVLKDPDNIRVTTYSGKIYTAFSVGYDEEKDVAILGIEDVKFTPLKIADYKALSIGDDVYAIGAPKSMAYTLTKGVISAKERKIGIYTYIQTDAAINEGNSGGPLINEEGCVIGINTLKMSDSEGIGLAIPMTVVSEFIKSLNIEIDENGNVAEAIVQAVNDDEKDIPDKNNDTNKPEETEKSPLYVTVLVIALGVSVVLNVILIIMLVYQKRKNLNLEYDPRERTDFDIDILE